MSEPEQKTRGFLYGFRQAPVAYALLCLTIVAGAALAVFGYVLPSQDGRRRGGWASLLVLPLVIAVGVTAVYARRRGWVVDHRKRPLVERLRNWHTVLLILAIGLGVLAVLILSFRVWLWRHSYPMVWGPSVLFDILFVAAVPVLLWFRRRTGRKLRAALGHCVKCDYDLRGLTEPRCPECGTAFDPQGVEHDGAADASD